MSCYLSDKTCSIEKKHYSVLIRLVQNWEEQFWRDDCPEQRLFSYSARVCTGIALLQAYSFLAASTLDELYRKELAQSNPLLAWNIDLATQKIKKQAEISLQAKLEADPQMLFHVSPGLWAQLKLSEEQFAAALTEMMERIQADKEELCRTFFDGVDFGSVLQIDAGKGDKHQHGRSTCIVVTEHGAFMYKPRSMKVDVALYEMVRKKFSDTLLLPKAIDCGSYGYAEFIKGEPAQTEADAELFFERLGGMTALFQVFGSTDFHCENILAHGSFPALVDLETFLGIPTGPDEQNLSELQKQNTDLFQKDFLHSVYFSGILPHLCGDRELSSLLCKDENSILPLLNGQRVDVRDGWSAFEKGFRKIYHRCMENKAFLETYITRFETCSFRCLLRNTDDYAKLIRGFCSVKAFSNNVYREHLKTNIQKALGLMDNKPNDKQSVIAQAEMSAMMRGDIPMFHCDGGSTNLYADGACIIPDYFSEPLTENARYRMDHLSDAECDYELEMIRQSLISAHVRCEPGQSFARIQPDGRAPGSFRKEAEEVFDKIMARRMTGPSGESGWMDHRTDDSSFGALSISYGIGESGIAAFAAEYYQVTGDKRAAEVMESFLCSISRMAALGELPNTADALVAELGSLGTAGMLRAAVMASDALDKPEYKQSVYKLLDVLATLEPKPDTLLDYYGGLAGLLYTLCTDPVLRDAPASETLRKKLCDSLLAAQKLETKQGIRSWDTLNKKRPISGLGHGVAGIGLALAAAWKLAPSEELLAAVQNAFALEHQLYSDKLHTWPDFRESSVASDAMHGYCSGAPGMGSIYLQLHQWGMTEYDTDLQNAIDYTLEMPLLSRDHYCCGSPSSIEFLMDAGRMLERPELTEEAHRCLRQVVERKAQKGAYTFMPNRYENYEPQSLLNGLSGVGHVLLKADVPSLKRLL